ncbi:hypothetical protein [Natronococcus occultus]|uniref:Tripartite tricarboxylate transporter TctB family protein n=1 Tax=Natronococcus occultus SP4 TaxID=694430 RepID=L0JSD9_9EURY|nr:hypothetical protein [Natronococcus occultus]AGB35902.1 hypothetical protein Natoc_0019 [Natronococcus occultus SP4]
MEQDDTVGSVADRVRNPLETVLGERPTMEHVLLLLFLVVGVYMYQGASEFAPDAQTFPRLMAGGTAVLAFLLLARNYLTVVGPLVGAGLGAYLVYDGATAFLADDGGLASLVAGGVLLVVVIGFRERFGEALESFVAEPMQVMGDADATETPDEDVEEPATVDADEATAADAPSSDAESDSAGMYTYEIDDPKGPVVTGVLCIGYMLLTFTIGMLYATPIFVAAWALWARMDVLRAVALTVLGFASAYLFYALIQDDIAEGWLTGWELPAPDDLLGLWIHAGDLLQWGVVLA